MTSPRPWKFKDGFILDADNWPICSFGGEKSEFQQYRGYPPDPEDMELILAAVNAVPNNQELEP